MIGKIVEELKRYLALLEKQHEWQIHIHNADLIADKFSQNLVEFTSHENDYCNYIKSDDRLWKICLQNKKKVLNKSNNGIFYGQCHCGVGEFIVPILFLDNSIGFISVGEFRNNTINTNVHLVSVTEKYGLSIEALSEFYESSLDPNLPDMDFVATMLAPAARMLELVYSLQEQKLVDQSASPSHKTLMYYRILNYIRHSYKQKITVGQIAEFLNCSESYINHTFTKMNGMSISNYINKFRIERAERLLITTDRSIKEVSFDVGFSEYSYFSYVFKKINGISPKEFRSK